MGQSAGPCSKPAHSVEIALVGKLRRPARRLPVGDRGLASRRVRREQRGQDPVGGLRRLRDRGGCQRALGDVDAVCVPGGFGVRGIEGKLGAIRFARENKVPTLGLCLGLQCMVIEFARDVADMADANSQEFDAETTHPVVSTMADQTDVVNGERDMGRTMRLGLYPARLTPGSVVANTYGELAVDERHRHRYEVNNAYREPLSEAGLVFSGTSPDGRLVEFVELPRTCIPTSWPPRRTRSSVPARPGRTAVLRLGGGGHPPAVRWMRSGVDRSRTPMNPHEVVGSHVQFSGAVWDDAFPTTS